MTVVTETVTVSKEPADVFAAVVALVRALKEGKSPLAVALGELMQLQRHVEEVKQFPALATSERAAFERACLLAAADLLAVFTT